MDPFSEHQFPTFSSYALKGHLHWISNNSARFLINVLRLFRILSKKKKWRVTELCLYRFQHRKKTCFSNVGIIIRTDINNEQQLTGEDLLV